MCYHSRSLPVAVPLAISSQGDGTVELEYTLALAKVTTLRDGEHRSTNGARPFSYPLGRGWVRDPDFERGSHTRCLHFAAPRDAIRGELSSYGSHRLIVLPSKTLYGDGTFLDGQCWHDAATLPVCCLACDAGDDASALDAPEFWAEIRGRHGGDLGDDLYRARAVLPEAAAPRGRGPLDLAWIRKTQRIVDRQRGREKVVARWAIEESGRELAAQVRMVLHGWWLENRYSIEVCAGECVARAILCEDEEHGLYFYVADHAFGSLLTGEGQAVALVTPVAADVVEYLDRVPGRRAIPPSAQFPRVHHPRFRAREGAGSPTGAVAGSTAYATA